MADTRCANPEYQVDVDSMMLEYTVYKAIEAQSHNLKYQIDEMSEDALDGISPSDLSVEARENSARLQETSDYLISLFRLHHPSTKFSPACDYNIRILQLLVLLEQWLHLSSRTLLGCGSNWMLPNTYRPGFVYPQRPSESSERQLKERRAVETVFRRNWLGLRYGESSSECHLDGVDQKRRRLHHHHQQEDADLKLRDSRGDQSSVSSPANAGDTITPADRSKSESLYPPNEEKPCLSAGIVSGRERLGLAAVSNHVREFLEEHSLFSITLFDLIPLFMDLSAEISGVKGPVNDRWIELASEFMWQSALERLQQMPDAQYTKPSKDPFKTISEDFGTRVWVEECFAWGSGERPSSTSIDRIKRELEYMNAPALGEKAIQDRLQIEDQISAMLTGTVNGEDDGINNNYQANADHPQLQQRREAYLSKLLHLVIEERPVSDNVPFYIAVRRLCEQSPVKPFLNALHGYIDGLFHINVDPDFSGKPILVQIESGSLEGLDDAEFKAFLDRVGLKMSSHDTTPTESIVKWYT